MNSIKSHLGPKKNKIGNKVIPLSLALIILVVSTSQISSLQFIKPVMAVPLTGVSASPSSNVVNEKATYDFFLTTGSSATIKKIEITFHSSFDISGIRLIERNNIGSGSLSRVGSVLTYTLNSAETVSAGKTIRLEIGRIMATAEGSFKVSIQTLDTQGGTIDGPTTSGSFTIKSIDGDDVSTEFMIRKTVNDDDAGHALGWDPNSIANQFVIKDSDVVGDINSILIDVMLEGTGVTCHALFPAHTLTGQFTVICSGCPPNNSVLHYVITKLPSNVATTTSSSSSATGSSTSSLDLASIARLDEITSEFP